jgi:hypothetical protein
MALLTDTKKLQMEQGAFSRLFEEELPPMDERMRMGPHVFDYRPSDYVPDIAESFSQENLSRFDKSRQGEAHEGAPVPATRVWHLSEQKDVQVKCLFFFFFASCSSSCSTCFLKSVLFSISDPCRDVRFCARFGRWTRWLERTIFCTWWCTLRKRTRKTDGSAMRMWTTTRRARSRSATRWQRRWCTPAPCSHTSFSSISSAATRPRRTLQPFRSDYTSWKTG